jgi:translation elongation factor EF-1alpha
MTREIGILRFDTPNKICTIFDTPGNKNYINNMILGAT